jgi:hypothetical protein
MTQPETAAEVSGEVPLCHECVVLDGLCVRHAKSVCPQLAQPHWYQLVGTDYQKPPKPSAEAQRIADRKARKQQRLRDRRRAEMADLVTSLPPKVA